jgi:hypothetical protein
VYPAGNENFPNGSAVDLRADIWLPDAPLVADAAIFNANFATRYDQQINLFVSPGAGTVQFWGLEEGASRWQVSSSQSVIDGDLHTVRAAVRPGEVTLSVDGQEVTAGAESYDTSRLDRIEIGTSTSSSGPFTGLLRRVVLRPPE